MIHNERRITLRSECADLDTHSLVRDLNQVDEGSRLETIRAYVDKASRRISERRCAEIAVKWDRRRGRNRREDTP